MVASRGRREPQYGECIVSRPGIYTNPLSLTSQFYFCGLPLRLDTYGDCQFGCLYCFAATRGGQRGARGIRPADGPGLIRRLCNLRNNPATLLGELFGVKQPVHFGGMSDPLPPVERRARVTLAVLRNLAEDDYPLVLSTKSALVMDEEYSATLRRRNALVQVSFSVADDDLSRLVDRGAPSTSARIAILNRLRDLGIKTAARLQPVLPTREEEALALVYRLAAAGVSHVGFEFLKLPLEGWPQSRVMSTAIGFDLTEYFRAAGARRIGREWVLPVAQRFAFALQARTVTNELGMSFGAADTDLLPLSDTSACCSGADRLLPDASTFGYNYLGAIARADMAGRVRLSSLQDVWRPNSSASSMINSRSRIPAVDGVGRPVSDYIQLNWNGRKNGCAPDMFYGVTPTDHRERDGSIIYQLSAELMSLRRSGKLAS